MSFGAIAGGIGANILGGVLGAKAAEKEGNRNRDLQREFATHGIRWKVADAQAAGIHPLLAMGATGAQFQPVSTGAPEIMANMGQNIGRAVQTGMSAEDRNFTQQMQAEQLKEAQLKNELLKAQVTSINKPQTPGLVETTNFVPGQGNSGLNKVKVNPSERTATGDGRPNQQAGWVPDVGFSRTETGLTPVPSKDVKERIEDQIIPELMWAIRNYGGANLGQGAPPTSDLPKGAIRWRWSYIKQEWQPEYKQPTRNLKPNSYDTLGR